MEVKAKTGNTTDATVYADWYKSVYLPAADPVSLQASDSGKSVLEKSIGDGDPEKSSLDLLTIGMVNDMFVESRNDEYKGWRKVATQEDFDRF